MATASGGDGASAGPPADAAAAATATEAQAEPHGKGKRKGKEPALNTGETSSGAAGGANPFEAVAQQERRVKITGRIQDPLSHEVLQKSTVDQEAIEQERTRQHEELVALKNRKLDLKEMQMELQRERIRLQEKRREHRIMMLDLDKLSDMQREYFISMQMHIINKLHNSAGSKGGD
ncbi:hypothetical protein U9M48_044912 [Paspalum notatum var. saurae]|uniref:No apical meristem-associated C-terminal domain-containing protein n=1 Tax=Paspalum notatum var. saurae TaxID=547442 RepID=A0AAQ3UXW1_PASNO